MIAFFGCAIAIVPFIVVTTEYKDNPAKIEVQTWFVVIALCRRRLDVADLTVDHLLPM